MALESGDSDIRPAWMYTILGGNGDYYICIVEDKDGDKVLTSIRIPTSGGNAPSDVKIAVAELYRAMEKHGLNEYPDFMFKK